MNTNRADEEVPLLHLLPILQRLIRLTDAHKEYGLTKSQAVLMIALRYRGSLTMSEIAQYISSSKEQATRAVSALHDRGLVERFEQPENRTHVYIRLSEDGRSFIENFELQLRTGIVEKLKSSLSQEEIETLRGAVQTAVDILSKVE